MKAIERAQSWLVDAVDEATQSQIRDWMTNGANELEEAFYDDLEFGTGGLRGLMGVTQLGTLRKVWRTI
jgi:phosphoglucomutase